MRTAIAWALLLVLGWSTQGQGYLTFGNRVTAGGLDAPVYDWRGNKLDGSVYLAQLYVGQEANSLAPVGPVLSFRTGAAAGYITSTVVVVDGIPGGEPVWVAMRAWIATPWVEEPGSPSVIGSSNVIPMTLAAAPDLPPIMVGLRSFAIHPVPEAQVGWLLGVGLILWIAAGRPRPT